MKYKWPLLLLVVITVAVVAVSVFLYYFLAPKVTVVKTVELSMPDSSKFAMATLRLSDINIW
jgi:hypothetical protein